MEKLTDESAMLCLDSIGLGLRSSHDECWVEKEKAGSAMTRRLLSRISRSLDVRSSFPDWPRDIYVRTDRMFARLSLISTNVRGARYLFRIGRSLVSCCHRKRSMSSASSSYKECYPVANSASAFSDLRICRRVSALVDRQSGKSCVSEQCHEPYLQTVCILWKP